MSAACQQRQQRSGKYYGAAVRRSWPQWIQGVIKHGAKPFSNEFKEESSVVVLASQVDAPLDLFDLLCTPENINDCSQSRYLPLHYAAAGGHNATALHLIKLGASVDQQDGLTRLPIGLFLGNINNYLNMELFMALLPSRTMVWIS